MGYDKNGKPTLIPASQVVVDSSSGKTLKESIDYKELGNNVKNTLSGGETDASPSVAVVKSELDKRPTTQQVNSELSRRPTTQQINEVLSQKADKTAVNNKQDKLVSGQNIKTVGGVSILGRGNIPLPSSSGANIAQTVNPSDTANAPSSKAVAAYVAEHGGSGSANIVEGANVTIETLPNGKKRINAQLAGGTAQAASEVSTSRGRTVEDELTEIKRVTDLESITDMDDTFIQAVTDAYGRVLTAIDKKGKFHSSLDNPIEGCNLWILGDSISTSSYYVPKLKELVKPKIFRNFAVAGATWADYADSPPYDGIPKDGSDPNQGAQANKLNVMGNQLQTIINGYESGIISEKPDIIIMAAITNDSSGMDANYNDTDAQIRNVIDSHFVDSNGNCIPITNATFGEEDTFKTHRLRVGGAIRYVVQKLHQLYPTASLYLMTPIQASIGSRDYLNTELKQRYITECGKHLSVPVIHVGEECGISQDFEYNGTFLREECIGNNGKNGENLADSLHPNHNGSWRMAYYIFNAIKNSQYNEIKNRYTKYLIK